MPIYVYVCDNCGYEFEEFQSISAEPLRVCPQCGSAIRKKIGSGIGLLFKGSGFYVTDYKNNNKSTSNNSERNKPEKSTNKTKKAS